MTHTPDEIAAMIERLTAPDCWYAESPLGPRRNGGDPFEAAAMLREVAAERDAMAISEQNTFNQRNMVLDALQRTEAKADRLAAMVEKLGGYAVHDENCNRVLSCRNYDCTCGLSDVLKESEDG